jgi:hypothetical protein
MESISTTASTGDAPVQQSASADVNVLMGVMVLGERPGYNAFGGMALIFMGLIAIDGRLVKGFRRRKGR